MKILDRLGGEMRRFATAATAGLVVDLSVAWALASFTDLSLTWAAAGGFVAGTSLNYVLHELWTFQGGEQRLSLVRMARYSSALTVTLVVRLAAVEGLSRLISDPQWNLPILIAATAISFVANYLISRTLVFREQGGTGPSNAAAGSVRRGGDG